MDQTGIVLDVLVQRRGDKQAAKRLLSKLLKKGLRPPRVMITCPVVPIARSMGATMPSRGLGRARYRRRETTALLAMLLLSRA